MVQADGIWGIAAALAVILSGIFLFIVMMWRRPTPERLGFAPLFHIPPRAVTLGERLFAKSPHSIFYKRAVDRDLYLMFVEAGSSETPDCVLGFTDSRTYPRTGDFALLHSQQRIPNVLRRLQGGMFNWARPVNPATGSLHPGTGWFWYAAEDGQVEDTPLSRALAHFSRARCSMKLLGAARLGSDLVVWASRPHIGTVVACLEHLSRGESDITGKDGF